MRRIALLFLGTLLAASLLTAQMPQGGNPLVSESRTAYTQIKNNFTKLAEKATPEVYAFRPVAEIRTFGETIAHVADYQLGQCSGLTGERKQGQAASLKTRDELVTAIKASFAECDAAWEKVSDANALEMLAAGRGQRSRLGILIAVTTHANEEYGYLAVYLRLKGIVPPSSETTAAPGRGAAPPAPGR